MAEYEYSVGDRTQNITEAEYRNMEGRLYQLDYTASVADSATEYMHITTGDKPVKILSSISGTGAFEYLLYEDQGNMDIVDDGTAQTPLLMNRAASNTENTSWQSNPTVNNTGTELIDLETQGTSGSNPPGQVVDDSVPGATAPEASRILDSNTEYLVEVIDRTSDSNKDTIQMIFNFWEMEYNLN